MGKVRGLSYYCMNMIEDNNSEWSIRGCLLLDVVLVGIIVNGGYYIIGIVLVFVILVGITLVGV